MIKLLSTLAIAGASLLPISAAQASYGWKYIGTFSRGPVSAKVDSYAREYVNLQVAIPNKRSFPVTIDCLRYRYTIQSNGRGWEAIDSGSLGGLLVNNFCS
jgi:hypothetical protein